MDDTPDGAYHMHVSILETASVAYGSYIPEFGTDEVKEIPGDSMSLDVIPSYLVAESEYFSDRLAGLLVIDKSITDVVQTLDMVAKPWDDDYQPPEWRLRDVAYLQERVLERYKALARVQPEALELATALNQVPQQDKF